MLRLSRVLSVLLLVVLATPTIAAERYDPRLRFRTLKTSHFDIHFHQNEDALARRLARIAEEVASRLEPELGRPSGRVRVILVDQGDLANGWATPVPYNLIEIQAVPPRAESTIGNTDDWLRLVFSHEYTHVVHLDRSRGWFGRLRPVFGRLPLLFPNIFLPQWQIEGLATYEESALTGAGRIRAGDFRMLMERAAARGRFLSLDRASGGLVDWPSGAAAYLYGGFFHEYLAARYGADSLARLVEETARRVPYFGTRAYRKVFGRALGELWEEFETEVTKSAPHDQLTATRLTSHGFEVSAPRFDAGGGVYYAVSNPHGFPSLMHVIPGQAPRTITSRYGGNQTAVAGNLVLFDQLEIVRNVGLQSDLYVYDAKTGNTRRLTRHARAADPDLSPDGHTLVCTVQETGSRTLATLPLPAAGVLGRPATLLSARNTEYSSPRWSPDARTIVAERRRVGGPSELVLVDVQTRSERTLVSSHSGRNVSPEWAANGRSVLFARETGRHGFQIHVVDVESGAVRRLIGAPGATAPVLSPDGRTVVFVGYTTDGHDLFAIDYDEARWEPVSEPPVAEHALDMSPPAIDAGLTDTSYQPYDSLAPTFWTPIAASESDEISAGAATGGMDALGRHTYYATAAWTTSRGRPDWTAAYVYDRWWPTLYVDVSDDTDPWRSGDVRTREANIGVVFPLTRVRWRQSALAAWQASSDHVVCDACSTPIDSTFTRQSARVGWLFSSAKSYGYSVSAETGATIGIGAEVTRRTFGADGDATAVTATARHYVPVWPRHAVLAARAAAAWSGGDEVVRRVFTAAGSGPQAGVFAFGTDAVGLLRGYDEGDVAGYRAIVANLDYRFPLKSLQRGYGTLPLFVRTVHGALFADVGRAWDDGQQERRFRRSFGVELSLDMVLGHALPVTLTGGVARRDDPVLHRRDTVGFARIGRAF